MPAVHGGTYRKSWGKEGGRMEIAAEFKCLACNNSIRIYRSGLELHYQEVAKMVRAWCKLHKACQRTKGLGRRLKRDVERAVEGAEVRAVREAELIIRGAGRRKERVRGLEETRRILRLFLTDEEIKEIMGGEG